MEGIGRQSRHESAADYEVPELSEKEREVFDQHLALRFSFAKRVSELSGEPFWLSIRKYTDVYSMLHMQGAEAMQSIESRRRRQQYEWSLEHAQNEEEMYRVSDNYYRDIYPRGEMYTTPWFPFKYTYEEDSGTVGTHFIGSLNPALVDDKPSAISSERLQESRAKLRLMFEEIKLKHPDAEYVEGFSWLYNLEAYRRLYPSAYIQSAEPWKPGPNDLAHPALWAQFFRKDGTLNMERAAEFQAKLPALNIAHLEKAFPLMPIKVGCNIQEFYKEYGIE